MLLATIEILFSSNAENESEPDDADNNDHGHKGVEVSDVEKSVPLLPNDETDDVMHDRGE